MIKMNSKQLMNIFLAAFVLFSIITITTNTSTAYAAASPVGIVNYQLLVEQHPDSAKAQTAMNDAAEQAKTNFDTKSVNMNDQEKQSYYEQLQRGLQIKQQNLLEAIQNKVNDAVKAVAKSKGLTIVVDTGAAVYGEQDITDDVMKKIVAK
ncbi:MULTISPECIES: OmpH family outer membrane protein [Pelosinus]|uniref:Outer membrane chaperone Skp (OmpH) n=1 Tax=Pelosinus fermentans B4 TaxID=1149862 RepID=I9AU21_9FIRM|nr:MULTISPECIES: OmpH family outer membrane protein [Pelosinus]EIW16447.1 outer membrane chaperone Skp (OmpH) [Pelosinus fermentans B4]EIW22572.1 outer membrane chaperone Skp (OmpH) [Pelosinus fermentans A11]OAM95754.1 outer membrane chaperone Skp (OmpH) [Pelosinus fermentans DSM 17108]SDR32417.1 periplasmic chaperone for outer membrane proteins Skp [Pelosinus fermentans]